MSLDAKTKAILYDLQCGVVRVMVRFEHEEGVLYFLDDACRAWTEQRRMFERDCELDSIDHLELSVRVDNVLHKFGVRTIARLRSLSDGDFANMGIQAKRHRKAIAEALDEWNKRCGVK